MTSNLPTLETKQSTQETASSIFLSKKNLQKKIATLEQAVLLCQQMTMQSTKVCQELIGKNKFLQDIVEGLQYKLEIIAQKSNIDLAEVNELVDKKQVELFDLASEKENKENGLIDSPTVVENSIVTITTKVGEKVGYIRSKLDLSYPTLGFLKDKLLGLPLGGETELNLEGETHLVTILAIKVKGN